MAYPSVKIEWHWCIPSRVINPKLKVRERWLRRRRRRQRHDSRGTKVEKMLPLAPERYTAGFCMVAKAILWCICNHCKADSINLHNARAVNFLRKISKKVSKYHFSKCHIFLSKKFQIEKYWVYIIKQHRSRPQRQWWSSENTAYWFLKHGD